MVFLLPSPAQSISFSSDQRRWPIEIGHVVKSRPMLIYYGERNLHLPAILVWTTRAPRVLTHTWLQFSASIDRLSKPISYINIPLPFYIYIYIYHYITYIYIYVPIKVMNPHHSPIIECHISHTVISLISPYLRHHMPLLYPIAFIVVSGLPNMFLLYIYI